MELNPNDAKLLFQRENWSDDYEFALAYKAGPDMMVIAQPLVFEQVPNGALIKTAFTLRRNEMQSLFNKMWAEGFRPADGTGNSGHTEAVKYHLEDMRKLVFKASQP